MRFNANQSNISQIFPGETSNYAVGRNEKSSEGGSPRGSESLPDFQHNDDQLSDPDEENGLEDETAERNGELHKEDLSYQTSKWNSSGFLISGIKRF